MDGFGDVFENVAGIWDVSAYMYSNMPVGSLGGMDMRRVVVLAALIAVFCSGILGNVLMSAMAGESAKKGKDAYFTSIRIEEGDTLWSIADEYADDLDMSLDEYIRDLRLMNHLEGDTIHVGRYLTVMYRGK